MSPENKKDVILKMENLEIASPNMSPNEIANAKIKIYNEILAAKNIDPAVRKLVEIEKEYYENKLQELANKKLEEQTA